MGATLPTFTAVEDSLLLTLYCRALDNRLPKPVLSDRTADEIVRKLDYDFEQLKVNKNFILNVALRAKKLDEVASGFIRHHPDAVGLDLGAGLDTRIVRIAAPATVDWYDVDYQLCRLGQQARPRHLVRRRPPEVSRRRRPERTRALEPETETDQGNPSH
jgi:hypothetical protein